MSQNQNSFVARKGQAEVVIYQRNNPALKILPVKFPGGYGKTDTIALSYNDKRSAGQVDRLLIVVANDVQLAQIRDEFSAGCRRIGFEIPGGVFPCDANHNAFGVSRKNKAEIYVTTIQRVSSTNRRKDFDMLRNLMQDGHRWMLAADEYHHYSTGNDWGIALQRLVNLSVFTIATSATPDRDNEPTIFGNPLVKVSYKNAVLENAVKKMELRHWDFRVVAEDIPTGQTVEFTTDQLRQEKGTDEIDVFMQKRNLRFHPDYVNPVLQGAMNALFRDKLNLNPHAQLLVRALSCNHAKVICDQINSYGYSLSCDWIGTKSEYNGRPDDENAAVIKRFCPPKDTDGIRPNPTLDILVQVGMAGEGFDSIMVSQLADLSLVAMKGNANQTKQFVLRGARWIPGGDVQYQVCRLNVGKDHPVLSIPGLDIMEWLDSNIDFNPAGTTGPLPAPQGGNGGDTFVDPDWTKGYNNLREVELIAVSKDDPVCQAMMNEIRKGSTDPDFWTWENPQAVERFRGLWNEMLRGMQKQQQDLNELGKQDHLRGKIKGLVNKTVNELIVRCGKSRTEVQSLSRMLNRELAKACGSWAGKATSEQLQISWDYLHALYSEIISGRIPPWAK
jgi:superfamily II DNA or RNA helicase